MSEVLSSVVKAPSNKMSDQNDDPFKETNSKPKFMKGVVIVLHGKLIGTGYTHLGVKRIATKLGGCVETGQKLKDCTHLITTQREIDRFHQHPKIQIANLKKCLIISVDWLIKCNETKSLVPVDVYLLEPTVYNTPKAQIELAGAEQPEPSSEAIATHLQGLIANGYYPFKLARSIWPGNSDNKVQTLGLQTISIVNKSTPEYQMLENYFNFSAFAYAPPVYTTAASWPGYTTAKRANIRVMNIYRIERLNEAARHTRWKENNKSKYNPRLLWHGSPKQNFSGILRDGLRGDVREHGIYASELAGYSISYCQKAHTNYNKLGVELMLLCEASILRANSNGCKYRDAKCIHPDLAGIDMLDIAIGERYPNGWTIQYEHCMTQVEQMRMRYLFQFEVCA